MNPIRSLLLVPLLLLLTLPGQTAANPQFKKLKAKLEEKSRRLKNRNKFRLPNKTHRRASKAERAHKLQQSQNLFRVRVGSKKINYSRIHTVKLPIDPTLPDCTHKEMQDRTDYRNYRGRIVRSRQRTINSKLRWARNFLWENKSTYYTEVELCNKGLKYIHQAYCIDANNRSVTSYMRSARAKCLPAYKRWWITELSRLRGVPVPKWAKTKSKEKSSVKSELRWLEMDLKNPSKQIAGMKKYLNILASHPNNVRAQQGFDYMYAVYFGTSKAAARLARTTGKLGGRYDDLSKEELYQLAIDELTGVNNKIVNGVLKTRLDYLGVNYLLHKVYLPMLYRFRAELVPFRCSSLLRDRHRPFGPDAVKNELKKPRGLCSGYGFQFSGHRFMTDPRTKFAFIKILARYTKNPAHTIKVAARRLVKQIGAPSLKVCWLYENPYPESVRSTFGPKANCNAFAFSGMHNSRPGFFNYIYKTRPIKKYSKLQNAMAQEILREAGALKLAKRFKKAYRRAKGYKCLAWNVTIAKDSHGGGRWSKPYRYSNGGPREIPCRRMRRNGTFRRIFKGWNNFFDTVVGGKYTRGRWKTTIYYSRYGRGVRRSKRRTRPAEVYVKRKF